MERLTLFLRTADFEILGHWDQKIGECLEIKLEYEDIQFSLTDLTLAQVGAIFLLEAGSDKEEYAKEMARIMLQKCDMDYEWFCSENEQSDKSACLSELLKWMDKEGYWVSLRNY